MSKPDIHDGEMVRKRLARSALSAAELGRRMGLADKQIYRLLKTKNWYTDQLAKAGEALGWDFFTAYHIALGHTSPMVHAILVNPLALQSEESRLQALKELRFLLNHD